MAEQSDKKVKETKEEVTEAIVEATTEIEGAAEAADKAETAAAEAEAKPSAESTDKAEAAAEKAAEAVEEAKEAVKEVAEKVEQHEAAETKEKQAVPAKFKDLVKSIESLSVLELSELVKTLESHFGVTASAPMAMAAAPVAGGGTEEAAAAKTNYTIVLAAAGDQKINAIKAVREITGLGLAESKALVDGAPKPLKENVPQAEAEEAKKLLEAAGATVELK